MSRIQEILNKAEREGTTRRTRALADQGPSPAAAVAAPPVAVAPPPVAIAPPIGAAPPIVAPPVVAPRPVPPPVTSLDAPPLQWADASMPAVERHTSTPATPRLDARLVAATSTQSLAAEQYRLLRTRLKRAENGRAMRAIVVTSPSKGDGKSLTAANLALTMAQEFNERVLLIDADFRRHSIAQLFGIPDSPGLSDVLAGGADLDTALVSLGEQRLTVLPAGHTGARPTELLGSATMRRVLDTLRTRFDRILIDMPPVSPVADVHVVAPMADGVLMIVRAGVTAKPAIEAALSGLDASRVLGLVLNDAEESRRDRRTYEGYKQIAG